jgi:hypothetical protein
MPKIPCKRELNPHRQRLLELMQQVNFGRLERLQVSRGNPCFDPPPRVIRELKLGSDNGPRPELQRADFELKTQVVELLQCLDEVGDGVIETIEVKHGLPFRVLVEGVKR